MNTSGKKKFETLSPREHEVIGLAAAGLLDKQISPELNVSLNTLRTYWTRIREKVGSESRPALVAAYVMEELGQVDDLKTALDSHEGWVLNPKDMTMLATDRINDDHGLARGVPHPMRMYSGRTHPDDVDMVWQLNTDVAEGKRDAVQLTYRVVTETSIDLINATVQSIRDSNGEVVKVYGFRTKTRDCRSESNLNVRVGHWEESDYESDQFWVDEEMARILGCAGPGMVSREAEMNWQRHPEDEVRIRRLVLESIGRRQEDLVTDVRLMLGDGSLVWGRAKRRFVFQDNGQVRIFGTFSVFE